MCVYVQYSHAANEQYKLREASEDKQLYTFELLLSCSVQQQKVSTSNIHFFEAVIHNRADNGTAGVPLRGLQAIR